eukprot:12642429-Alexandrium_andersonii.AAC.1
MRCWWFPCGETARQRNLCRTCGFAWAKQNIYAIYAELVASPGQSSMSMQSTQSWWVRLGETARLCNLCRAGGFAWAKQYI